MSAVKEMVEQVIEDAGVSREAAIESVAETMDMTPAQVLQECIQAEEDELGVHEEEPPAKL